MHVYSNIYQSYMMFLVLFACIMDSLPHKRNLAILKNMPLTATSAAPHASYRGLLFCIHPGLRNIIKLMPSFRCIHPRITFELIVKYCDTIYQTVEYMFFYMSTTLILGYFAWISNHHEKNLWSGRRFECPSLWWPSAVNGPADGPSRATQRCSLFRKLNWLWATKSVFFCLILKKMYEILRHSFTAPMF